MKNLIKYLLLLLLSIIYFSCNNEENIKPKENLPNSDFEVWEADGNFEKPENWNTSNFSLYNIVSFNTVIKVQNNSYSGEHSAKLETKSQIIDNNLVKIVGLITLGQFDINISTRKAKVFGGVPFSCKPANLEGYFKYSAVGIDSCFFDIALTKFDTEFLKRDTIASGRFSSSTVLEWTHFELPIKYFSNIEPDSMNIVILSSDTTIFESGSTLWVDNLSLKY